MNTKALRQKILDLAIHGKLVPQDPNDEPASVLLERIRAEKERLIKEGKIKKPKKSKATCDKPRYPFQLPEGWVWCKLDDYVLSVTDGDHQAPPKSSKGIPFLVISNIATGKIDFTNTRYVPEEYYENIQQERKAKRGDILFSVTGSYGIVVNVETDQEFCFQRHIGLIKPVIGQEYLSYILMSDYIKGLCDDLATGTAQKTVGLDTLRSFYIPIAPIQEQARIVAKIEQLLLETNALESGKENMRIIVKQAKSKILDLAIHGKLVPQDPNDEPAAELLKRINTKAEITCDNPRYGKSPSGWCFCKISSVVDIVNGKSQKNVESTTGKYPIYGSGGIIGKSTEYTCLAGSTIIGRKGTINHPIFVEENFWNVDTAFGMKANNQILDDKYFYFFCLSFDFSKLDKSSALPSLTKTAIGNQILPIPPFAEQYRIVAKIEELFAQLDKIESSL